MKRKKSVIIRSNALNRDVRIPKEIAVLKKNNIDVTFIGWNRELCSDPQILQIEHYDQKLLHLKAPYGKIILPYLSLWWIYISIWLIIKKWDVAHVINFDSAIPAIIISKLKNKKVIYEILDTYEDSMVLPRHLRNFLIRVDKIFLSLSDFIILADDAQVEEFQGIPNKNITAIYDSPPDANIKKRERNDSAFILFYAGVLYKDRNLNLDKIFAAIQSINGVKLVIAGYGDLVPEIIQYQNELSDKIQYIGKISYSRVMEIIQECDLLFVLRDPSVPINKYICGSTLLNSMMCGKPIIVNQDTSTAIKVIEEKCGLVVKGDDIDQIKNAIIILRDNVPLYNEMGINARKAYVSKYSWDIMGNKLLHIYEKILY